MKKQTLSDKITDGTGDNYEIGEKIYLKVKDVKEAVKELKEELHKKLMCDCMYVEDGDLCGEIDKIFGEKLI